MEAGRDSLAFGQDPLDHVAVESATDQQRVEPLAAEPRLESPISGLDLRHDPARQGDLVGGTLLLLEASARRRRVVRGHTAATQLDLESPPSRGLSAETAGQERARVLGVVDQPDRRQPLEDLLDHAGFETLIA